MRDSTEFCLNLLAWLIFVILAGIALFCAGCATQRHDPTVPVPFKLGAEETLFHDASANDPTIIGIWNYGPLITTNFRWDLQGSSNMVNWITEQTNLGPSDVYVTTTNRYRFYRMRAHD